MEQRPKPVREQYAASSPPGDVIPTETIDLIKHVDQLREDLKELETQIEAQLKEELDDNIPPNVTELTSLTLDELSAKRINLDSSNMGMPKQQSDIFATILYKMIGPDTWSEANFDTHMELDDQMHYYTILPEKLLGPTTPEEAYALSYFLTAIPNAADNNLPTGIPPALQKAWIYHLLKCPSLESHLRNPLSTYKYYIPQLIYQVTEQEPQLREYLRKKLEVEAIEMVLDNTLPSIAKLPPGDSARAKITQLTLTQVLSAINYYPTDQDGSGLTNIATAAKKLEGSNPQLHATILEAIDLKLAEEQFEAALRTELEETNMVNHKDQRQMLATQASALEEPTETQAVSLLYTAIFDRQHEQTHLSTFVSTTVATETLEGSDNPLIDKLCLWFLIKEEGIFDSYALKQNPFAKELAKYPELSKLAWQKLQTILNKELRQPDPVIQVSTDTKRLGQSKLDRVGPMIKFGLQTFTGEIVTNLFETLLALMEETRDKRTEDQQSFDQAIDLFQEIVSAMMYGSDHVESVISNILTTDPTFSKKITDLVTTLLTDLPVAQDGDKGPAEIVQLVTTIIEQGKEHYKIDPETRLALLTALSKVPLETINLKVSVLKALIPETAFQKDFEGQITQGGPQYSTYKQYTIAPESLTKYVKYLDADTKSKARTSLEMATDVDPQQRVNNTISYLEQKGDFRQWIKETRATFARLMIPAHAVYENLRKNRMPSDWNETAYAIKYTSANYIATLGRERAKGKPIKPWRQDSTPPSIDYIRTSENSYDSILTYLQLDAFRNFIAQYEDTVHTQIRPALDHLLVQDFEELGLVIGPSHRYPPNYAGRIHSAKEGLSLLQAQFPAIIALEGIFSQATTRELSIQLSIEEIKSEIRQVLQLNAEDYGEQKGLEKAESEALETVLHCPKTRGLILWLIDMSGLVTAQETYPVAYSSTRLGTQSKLPMYLAIEHRYFDPHARATVSLEPVSFRCNAQQCTVISGPVGAGKTAALKMIEEVQEQAPLGLFAKETTVYWPKAKHEGKETPKDYMAFSQLPEQLPPKHSTFTVLAGQLLASCSPDIDVCLADEPLRGAPAHYRTAAILALIALNTSFEQVMAMTSHNPAEIYLVAKLLGIGDRIALRKVDPATRQISDGISHSYGENALKKMGAQTTLQIIKALQDAQLSGYNAGQLILGDFLAKFVEQQEQTASQHSFSDLRSLRQAGFKPSNQKDDNALSYYQEQVSRAGIHGDIIDPMYEHTARITCTVGGDPEPTKTLVQKARALNKEEHEQSIKQAIDLRQLVDSHITPFVEIAAKTQTKTQTQAKRLLAMESLITEIQQPNIDITVAKELSDTVQQIFTQLQETSIEPYNLTQQQKEQLDIKKTFTTLRTYIQRNLELSDQSAWTDKLNNATQDESKQIDLIISAIASFGPDWLKKAKSKDSETLANKYLLLKEAQLASSTVNLSTIIENYAELDSELNRAIFAYVLSYVSRDEVDPQVQWCVPTIMTDDAENVPPYFLQTSRACNLSMPQGPDYIPQDRFYDEKKGEFLNLTDLPSVIELQTDSAGKTEEIQICDAPTEPIRVLTYTGLNKGGKSRGMQGDSANTITCFMSGMMPAKKARIRMPTGVFCSIQIEDLQGFSTFENVAHMIAELEKRLRPGLAIFLDEPMTGANRDLTEVGGAALALLADAIGATLTTTNHQADGVLKSLSLNHKMPPYYELGVSVEHPFEPRPGRADADTFTVLKQLGYPSEFIDLMKFIERTMREFEEREKKLTEW